MALRTELVLIPTDDGGVDVFDPLLDRLHHFDPQDARHLDSPDAALSARMAAAMLLEGPLADGLRHSVVAARRARPPRAPALPSVPDVAWDRAADLPDGVSPRWRDGESLRRLAEARAAGATVLTLHRFLAPAFCEVLAQEARALPSERIQTETVHAARALVGDGLPALRELFGDAITRDLLGAVLGVSLPTTMIINAWTLEPGDHMAVHPDGPRYQATFAVGLNRGWRASDGGAIAFGQPREDGRFEVQQRWLPHDGDVCVFVPHATSWHLVEPPARTRRTVTGWWVQPDADQTT